MKIKLLLSLSISLIALIFLLSSFSNDDNKIQNLKTFAKAYGYVKYFHPSDEAQEIGWGHFAAYGAKEVMDCKSNNDLVSTLNKLFRPIAPTVVFSEGKHEFNDKSITPDNMDRIYSDILAASRGFQRSLK